MARQHGEYADRINRATIFTAGSELDLSISRRTAGRPCYGAEAGDRGVFDGFIGAAARSGTASQSLP